MIVPTILLALIAWPQGVQAQLGGAVVDVTSGVVGGPHEDTVTVDDGVELQDGDGSAVDAFFGPGDSIDIGQNNVTITLGSHLQAGFTFTNLDGPQDRDISALNLTGDLSSESILIFDNSTATAFLTINCNPGLPPPAQCNGGTLVLDITFALIGGGDPLQGTEDLKQAVIDLDLVPDTETPLVNKLNAAIELLEDGNPNNDPQAVNKLNEFKQTVGDKVENGTIEPAVGDALNANADDIIALI